MGNYNFNSPKFLLMEIFNRAMPMRCKSLATVVYPIDPT